MSNKDSFWREYTRLPSTTEMRPYIPGEDLEGVSISDADRENGHPKEGGMIARNSNNHEDRWYVNPEYYRENFVTEPLDGSREEKLNAVLEMNEIAIQQVEARILAIERLNRALESLGDVTAILDLMMSRGFMECDKPGSVDEKRIKEAVSKAYDVLDY